MDRQEQVVCLSCFSERTRVANRGQRGTGHWCPDCDESWDFPQTVVEKLQPTAALTAQHTIDARQLIQSVQSRLRRVQNVVLPRAATAIARSDQRLSASIGRQLASAQRLLDTDA